MNPGDGIRPELSSRIRTISSSSRSSQAGPSTSTSSSYIPSTPPQRTENTDTSTNSNASDGFLGVVAKWGNGGDDFSSSSYSYSNPNSLSLGKSTSTGARTSRMIGGRLGLSPPPPPGPPPSEPPPLPPNPTSHPFASTSTSTSRPRPTARLSSLASLRSAGVAVGVGVGGTSSSRASSPAGPPPTSELPPIPTRSNAPPSTHRRTVSASKSHDHDYGHNHTPSPVKHISPRSSSLINRSQAPPPPVDNDSKSGPGPAVLLGTPIRLGHEPLPLPNDTNPNSSDFLQPTATINTVGQPSHDNSSAASSAPSASGSSSTSSRTRASGSGSGTRTPSRHLLQTALDLAQRAVEMDKNNDVVGALAAYREAVERLKAVMERVGVEPQGQERRRRSGTGKTEEEGRTLRGIHDAYVARIQLLSSYETSPSSETTGTNMETEQETTPAATPQIEQPFNPAPTSAPSTSISSSSISSLAPSLSSQHLGDRTPRPSFEEGSMTGIGNYMLADQSFDSASVQPSPVKSGPSQSRTAITSTLLTPSKTAAAAITSTDSPKLPVINGRRDSISLQQALDQAAEASSGAGYPLTSTPTRTALPLSGNDGSPPLSSTAFSPSLSRGKRKGPSRPSLGLDMEADLTGVDGVEDIEELAKTPQSISIPRPEPIQGQGQPTRSGSGALPPSPRSIRSEERERPLPPLPIPNSAPVLDHMGQPIASRRNSLNRPFSGSSTTLLVSSSTAQGTISQRRRSRTPSGSILVSAIGNSTAPEVETHGQSFPTSSSGSSSRSSIGIGTRTRAKSQPGQRPLDADLPPIPISGSGTIRHKASASSLSQMLPGVLAMVQPQQSKAPIPNNGGLRVNTEQGLAPPAMITARSLSNSGSLRSLPLPPLPDTSTTSSFVIGGSPLPENQPAEVVHRPFHLLRVLYNSMDPEGPGAYLTSSIHISSAVWSPSNWSKSSIASIGGKNNSGGGGGGGGGMPKILAQDTKIRCIESLIIQMAGIRQAGSSLLDGQRIGSRSSGSTYKSTTLSHVEFGKIADDLNHALDDLEEEMENTHKALIKGGVGVGSWKGKGKKIGGNSKSWGSRISRSMDKMTNNKSVDSPDRYVEVLAQLCIGSQVIDEHLLNFTSECTPAYHSLSEGSYRNIEMKLRRSGEFVSAVIIPFILDDFKQFFLRYLKGGIRYLED